MPAHAAVADTNTGGSAYSANAGKHPKRITRLGDRVPVRQGMKGRDVRDLQNQLRALGLRVTVDGEFGPGTLSALRSFQRRAKLRVDGIVQSPDISALRRYSRGGLPPAPQPQELPPGSKAKVGRSGLAAAPADAPAAVKQIIAAGNRIATKPYRYGGGHGKWEDSAYDCSGSVSYALHGAGLVKSPMPSGNYESWGQSGPGKWVTIYANGGHIYMVVAGLRFDTSGANPSRWQSDMRSGGGYTVRHPAGL